MSTRPPSSCRSSAPWAVLEAVRAEAAEVEGEAISAATVVEEAGDAAAGESQASGGTTSRGLATGYVPVVASSTSRSGLLASNAGVGVLGPGAMPVPAVRGRTLVQQPRGARLALAPAASFARPRKPGRLLPELANHLIECRAVARRSRGQAPRGRQLRHLGAGLSLARRSLGAGPWMHLSVGALRQTKGMQRAPTMRASASRVAVAGRTTPRSATAWRWR